MELRSSSFTVFGAQQQGLDAPVMVAPEPGSFVLFGTGPAGRARVIRRRSNLG